MKADFTTEKLKEINDRMDGDYAFRLKTTAKSNLETDLSVTENGISLENHGKGQQVVMKAELTLKKSKVTPDVVLIEEPENHLSHVNMHKLLDTITSNAGQLLISTHSNLISSRLNLQHCILVNGNSEEPLKLTELSDDTSDYFMKAPPHNVLDFVLSKKVILVEGIAEYILAEKFYEAAVGRTASSDDVHIIEVGGTAFKRYLEIAKILGIKTVVIRDNDGDVNQADNYSDFTSDTIKIYTDQNATNTTFEISFYNANTSFCDGLFSAGRRTLTIQQYMLNNKTDAAFEILKGYDNTVVIPSYISDAMKWISE
jgi:predicted ATP-dependent endonuclease of OLD family